MGPVDSSLLRAWLAEAVTAARSPAALLALSEGDITRGTDGTLVAPLALVVLDAEGQIASLVEQDIPFAWAEDLETPDRTRAYLRGWARWAASRLGYEADHVARLGPIDFAPYLLVLDDLGNETEDDFFAALDDRTIWDSRPDNAEYPHDFGDLAATKPIARSDALEERLLASPTAESFDAYARWLSERGDPRGEVGVLEADGTRASKRRAQKIVADHVRYFYGPFPGTRRETWVWSPSFELDLERGWITAARIDLADAAAYGELDRVAVLRALFALPGARFLRDLTIADVRTPLDALEATGGHPAVRTLSVPCSEEDAPALRRLFPRLSAIEYADVEDDDEIC